VSESIVVAKPRFLGVLVLLTGISLLWGGLVLVGAGGSVYYLLAGLVLSVSGVLTFRGSRVGASLYGWFLLATVAWSLYEVGLDSWALMPRLGMFAVIGLLYLLPRHRRMLEAPEPPVLYRSTAMRETALGVLLSLILVLFSGQPHYEGPAPASMGAGSVNNADGGWAHYGASKSGTRFAPHDQINRSNVNELEVAWTFRTGVGGTFKATPIQVENRLFMCTGQNVVISLDADTGDELWRFNPEIDTPRFAFWDTCRGVTWYRVPEPVKVCQNRIYTATTDARLIALDAESGRPCEDFGEQGEISLLPGMGEVKAGFYYVTSPPTLARDTLVLGGWVADNQETEEPSGVVRGFDPITGKLKWAWDLGNAAINGLPQAGQTYTRGTPNVWSLTSADDELGLVYAPTGNATPDYFGGHRSEAMDKYSSSVVAIDAETGRAAWHFQTTHHDIWDYDVPSQPTLVDFPYEGETRKAVLVPTKRGQIFVLDRATGSPITEVQELPTPQTTVPEEWTSPTQPFSTGMPKFDRGVLVGADMWGITPIDQMICRIRFQQLDYEGPLTPPSLNGTLIHPGVGGGMNWGSVAVDEVNHLAVVNVVHMPMLTRLIPRAEVDESTRFGIGGRQAGTPYAAYTMPFFSPLFAPCLAPPYGELAVIDLSTQELVWRRPVGTARELGPLGLKSHLPLPMGVFIQGGTVVTSGGLIFTAGVADRYVRAFDVLDGREIWRADIPASSTATPMSYVSPVSGTQYVVITLPADAKLEIGHGDETIEEAAAGDGGFVIAFRLPRVD